MIEGSGNSNCVSALVRRGIANARETRDFVAPIRSPLATPAAIRVGRVAGFILAALAGGLACAAATQTDSLNDSAQYSCGLPLDVQGLGPCDYRIPTDNCAQNQGVPDLLRNVERHHFGPEIERLEGNVGTFEGEIQYTLTVFPNHHRALLAVARLAQKRRSDTIYNMKYRASCWFIRAITFAPDDAKPHVIYGLHLSNFGKKEDALKQFLVAEQLGADDANNMYNIGLLYFDRQDYDKALEYGKKAYAGGFQLPGLREKLRKVGKWQE